MGLSLGYNPFEPSKKKRGYVNKKLVKQAHGNKCKICRRTDKQVGGLEMAHLKAHSKGGGVVIPLCPTCHRKYDKGLLKNKERQKLGLSRKEYIKYRPNTKKKRRKSYYPRIKIRPIKIKPIKIKPFRI